MTTRLLQHLAAIAYWRRAEWEAADPADARRCRELRRTWVLAALRERRMERW